MRLRVGITCSHAVTNTQASKLTFRARLMAEESRMELTLA